MVESAALLVDEVLPKKPIRQWVLTVPFPLRFLFAAYPELMIRCWGSSAVRFPLTLLIKLDSGRRTPTPVL